MEGLLERISAARTRVQEQHAAHQRVLASLEAAEARIREGGREIDVLKARIKELEQESEVLRNAKAATREPEREGTKEKIDELVNEIDRCLALLNA